jgi:hypothetical protein
MKIPFWFLEEIKLETSEMIVNCAGRRSQPMRENYERELLPTDRSDLNTHARAIGGCTLLLARKFYAAP